MLQIRSLVKTYQGHEVLNNLNLHVKPGEVYGFIGKNGAGKTTTINCVLSMIHSTSGDILIDGERISFDDVTYKQKIGYVPDVPVFPAFMNGCEFLDFTCDVYRINRRDRPARIEDTLTFVGLEPANRASISTYSRGMKQRLAIAQALIADPELIIMDEPTSALDPIGRKDVIDIIGKLKGHKTVFYSTHILEDVEKVCDRIGVLHGGRLVVEDTLERIRQKYHRPQSLIRLQGDVDRVYRELCDDGFSEQVLRSDQGIVCKESSGIRPTDVLRTILERGHEVMSYQELAMSLEDIFMEVTNG